MQLAHDYAGWLYSQEAQWGIELPTSPKPLSYPASYFTYFLFNAFIYYLDVHQSCQNNLQQKAKIIKSQFKTLLKNIVKIFQGILYMPPLKPVQF